MRTTTLSAATRRTVLLGAGAALAAPHVAKAQTSYRAAYKLSVVGNRPIPLSKGAFHWAELVTQRSGGRINVGYAHRFARGDAVCWAPRKPGKTAHLPLMRVAGV
jgi:TRAP-type C4-dicarboxylate transport system substrate-binding protein